MFKTLFFSTLLISVICAEGDPLGRKLGPSNLPLPRYVSLRSNNVNVHVGPGTEYPVEWKYTRRHLPVEIIAEFDTWRKIRDADGAEFWVHKSLLSGRRYGIVLRKIGNLHTRPDLKSETRAKLEPGVLVRMLECNSGWCHVEIKGNEGTFRGWLKRATIWGIYPGEKKF